jgi:L-asparaginase / beta-aspartyl-peptidase
MIAIALHGGAGTISKSLMSDELEKEYKYGIENALNKGYKALENGKTSLDAVEITVAALEDFPLFNAGKGAVFTHNGKHEMDAAIMDGKSKLAGAVAGVSSVKNPVSLARKIMEKSEHVLLSGQGALDFAKKLNLPIESEDYFFNQFRFEQLQHALKEDKVMLDHTDDKKFGTVGAVALDQYGNIAAATSTGGMTNKKFGRIGDSPIIGSGTYANNDTCAVSCTGHGEFFIRAVVAYDISCLMEYKGLSLAEACKIVVQQKLKPAGGEGGLVALDKKGNICLEFNSEGMYRGYLKQGENPYIAIYA